MPHFPLSFLISAYRTEQETILPGRPKCQPHCSLHNQAPQYRSDLLLPYTQSRSFRSADSGLLQVPRTRLKNRGDLAFSVVDPKLWDSLPVQIRTASTLFIFKSTLKTYFVSLAFNIYWLAAQWFSVLMNLPHFTVCVLLFIILFTCFLLHNVCSTLVVLKCAT